LLLLSEISGGIWNEDQDGANVAVAIIIVFIIKVAIILYLSNSPKGGDHARLLSAHQSPLYYQLLSILSIPE